ncbi:MAG: hypothetical protein LBU16_09950 [Treponema sp.]|jgi:hypothetical protein|nr:hypothetical protein [Treponema sp.]
MKKNYLSPALLVFSLMVNGCASPPPPPPPPESVAPASVGFWNSMPSGDLVFIGGAGLRSNREESINLALEDIARKISIFHAVEGEFISYIKTGSSFFDYTSDTQSSLAFNEDYLGFTESLEYDPDADVMQINNTIFVRARYKGPEALRVQYALPSAAGGRPFWVDNPPTEISGYRVGIGYAGRRASHRDTVNASFEAALFSIIRTVSGHVSTGSMNYQGSGTFDYRSTNDATVRARGRLNSFYVLDTWIDPSNMSVWTLAIARPDEAAPLAETPPLPDEAEPLAETPPLPDEAEPSDSEQSESGPGETVSSGNEP